MIFGETLKALREDQDLKQEDIARFLNVDRSTVGKWESGSSKPDFEKLNKLADFFNVTTDYLLGRTDQQKPKDPDLPHEFTSPEEAMKFVLEQNVIMGFGGFDVNKMDDEEIINFANELLNQLKLLSYKYKK